MIQKIVRFNFILLLLCLLMLSCFDEINQYKEHSDTEGSIHNVLKAIKVEYELKYSSSVVSIRGDKPQWNKYEVLINNSDSILLKIPFVSKSNEENIHLIASSVYGEDKLVVIKASSESNDSLPMHIRRRILVYKDGKMILCRPITNKNGELRFVRLRDNETNKKSAPRNGGTFSGVTVWGSYEPDWWYWDYITGLISIPPPDYYSGYTGGYDEDPNKRPDFYKAENILKDQIVKKNIEKLKADMKNNASKEDGRREKGFWIYYDKDTKKYYVGNEKNGKYVKGGVNTNASIVPGSSSPKNNGDHIPKTATPVTFVHSHSPLTYVEDGRREVGFSPSDRKFADENNIEIIVIDYIGTKFEDGTFIEGGHDINDPVKEYIYTPKKK